MAGCTLRKLDSRDRRQLYLKNSTREKSTLDWAIVTWTEEFSDKTCLSFRCVLFVCLEVVRFLEMNVFLEPNTHEGFRFEYTGSWLKDCTHGKSPIAIKIGSGCPSSH